MPGPDPSFGWVVLTRGDRPQELAEAVRSIVCQLAPGTDRPVLIVGNGAEVATEVLPEDVAARVDVTTFGDNLGIPGGRDAGLRRSSWEVVAFLDDDAHLERGAVAAITGAFRDDALLGAAALRITDEEGISNPRHVPRPGGRDAGRGGDVATFLGGASAIRRSAYDDVGGYFTDLFYGHEEVELSWRLTDRGWRIRYLADAVVFHPRTEISRHETGWELTGRNRVLIARRTLPWPVACVHVGSWLLLGVWRAPDRSNRRAYLRGWWAGWRRPVQRAPIRWSTVWRLTRLGRPPMI